MHDLTVRTLDNRRATLTADTRDDLASGLRGNLLTEGSPGYDEARTVWNGMIDRRPALIARCEGAEDVRRAVRFAREHRLLTAVKGGGHHIAGNAVWDDVFMIDLSRMNEVRVDAEAGTVRVGPGATLGDLDAATLHLGLATPVGINSTTGVAGLTLGGGFGWLSRKHGLTVDHLLSAEVVTADGDLVTASEASHPDLFWGIRGGSGNFGVVTSFRFGLVPVGPTVFAGLVVYPFDEGADVLARYADFTAKAPRELAAWVVVRKAPPLPFLPEHVHGTEVVVIACVHCGDLEAAERETEPLTRLGTPLGTHLGPVGFAEFQQAFDPLLTPGARNYWKSHDFTELSEGAIETVLEYAGKLPSDQTEIFIAHLGGAIQDVPDAATAFPHREAEYVMNVHGRWEDPALDEACIGWAREFFDASAPFATGGVYVNFLSQDEMDRLRAAYGVSYDRLVQVKNRYDADNFFRLNLNIPPTG